MGFTFCAFPLTKTLAKQDLAGFTKWSSGRPPHDIFLLLETIYAAFDRIAKRRGVFKIETVSPRLSMLEGELCELNLSLRTLSHCQIGDCYLAITGVPCPQKDHAVIMAKFACDCMERMNYLIHSKLMDQLGEDTAELKLRVGLHSGPVTAGVLRGDRARFQLFGDTVNVAR